MSEKPKDTEKVTINKSNLSDTERNALISALTIHRTKEMIAHAKSQKEISQDCHDNIQKVIRGLIDSGVKYSIFWGWLKTLESISIIDSIQPKSSNTQKPTQQLLKNKKDEKPIKKRIELVYEKEEKKEIKSYDLDAPKKLADAKELEIKSIDIWTIVKTKPTEQTKKSSKSNMKLKAFPKPKEEEKKRAFLVF